MTKLYKVSAYCILVNIQKMPSYSLLLAFLLYSTFSYGQICDDILGEPLVNITFGTAANSLSKTKLDPKIGRSDYPNSIQPLSGVPYVKFHNAPDHTVGDVNGNMMVIDCAVGKPLILETVINGLCSCTKYVLDVWLANLLPVDGIDPNLTFNVRNIHTNEIIATVNSGAIPESSTMNWVNKALSFQVPVEASSVKIEILWASSGVFGNDLALDDVTVRPCLPDLHISAPNEVCIGEKAILSSLISSKVFENPKYQWQRSRDGENWQIIDVANDANLHISYALPGYYYRAIVYEKGSEDCTNSHIPSNVIALKTEMCKTDVAITKQSEQKPVEPGNELKYSIQAVNNGPVTARMINVIDDLPPEMQYMRTLVTKGEVNFNVQSHTLVWKMDSLLNNESAEMELWVKVESNRTLVNKASITYNDEDLYKTNNTAVDIKYQSITNVITPNGDGLNDCFTLPTNGQILNRINIFDRWGKLVFQNDNYNNNWSGGDLPIGTYYFSLEMVYKTRSSEHINGFIQLLR